MSFNVLITAASRRVPLVRAFRSAIGPLGGRVVVTDINPLSPAVHAADVAFRVPLSTAPEYLDVVLDLCQREQIALVIPTIDDELSIFGAMRPVFERQGIKVAVSSEHTSALCRDKYALCQHLRAAQVPAARSWLKGALPDTPTFPLFIKPRRGAGSINAFPIRTPRELEFFLDYVDDPIVQEFLIGPEFTIDLLCGFDHLPRAVVPRERLVVRAGVTDRGRTVNDPALIEIALQCAKALEFTGAINIQCRLVQGEPVVFEINPRFSGGIPLTLAAGADFPRMLVDLARGREVPPAIGRFQADLWMTNYSNSLYVEASGVSVLRAPTDPQRWQAPAQQVA